MVKIKHGFFPKSELFKLFLKKVSILFYEKIIPVYLLPFKLTIQKKAQTQIPDIHNLNLTCARSTHKLSLKLSHLVKLLNLTR